jgi:hypothetical protein
MSAGFDGLTHRPPGEEGFIRLLRTAAIQAAEELKDE